MGRCTGRRDITEIALKAALNTIPSTKLTAFVDDRIIVTQMMISVFDRVENIVGKGENAGDQHFVLLPPSFRKVFCLLLFLIVQ